MVTFILVSVIIYLLAAGGENGWYNRQTKDGFGRLNSKFKSRGKYSEYGYGAEQNNNQYGGQNPYGSSENSFGGNSFGGNSFGSSNDSFGGNSFGGNSFGNSDSSFGSNSFGSGNGGSPFSPPKVQNSLGTFGPFSRAPKNTSKPSFFDDDDDDFFK